MPREPRRNQKRDDVAVCYHIICRMTQGQFWLKDSRRKEVLRQQLWKVAKFSGVEVLAYCWMDNHVHLLVRVPPKRSVSDEELIRRCNGLYGENSFKATRIGIILRRMDADAVALRQTLVSRMHDLSEFVKTWKQRFGIWHNRLSRTFGTLWSERFKSLVVQDNPHVLRTVSAYIHLNPVRARIVKKPSEYGHSLYGECVCRQTDATVLAKKSFCSLIGSSLEFDDACRRYGAYLKNHDETIGDSFAYLASKLPPESQKAKLLADRGGHSMSKGSVIGTQAFVGDWLVAD